MNRKLLISLIALLSIVVLLTLAMLVFRHTSTTPSPGTNPFIFATSTATTSNAGAETSVRLKDGSTVAVTPFVLPQQPSWANDVNGYEVTSDSQTDYSILYYPNNSGFLVSLLAEPLGASRLEAEKELRSKLGLTNAQLCQLQAQVFTSVSVNETYAGQDLGLSFCPGATVLP